MNSFGYFDVREFGAKGDGITDDTNAIRKAIDEAAKVNGVVIIPPGNYVTGTLKLAPGMEIRGNADFSFRSACGSILRLRDDSESNCLIDMTYAYGAKVQSLNLIGRSWDDSRLAHGIMVEKPDYGTQEDTPCVDNCRIENFSGDGIHFERIWCFSVRHSHMFKNGGCGMRIRGWDGFVIDNWFTGNHDAGYGAYNENASVTMTGNRIEWNFAGGIVIKHGSHYNITGNYIDRSGNCGMNFENLSTAAVSGNIIYRSGKIEWSNGDELDSCQIKLRRCEGVTFCSNSLKTGRDDGGKGTFSPDCAIDIEDCSNCVVSMNTMARGALKVLILEKNNSDCIIKDNPGTLFSAD